MAALKLFADVLDQYHKEKKTGALYVSITGSSENLIRFYFKDGDIYCLTYGPAKDRECLDILDCYDLGKAVFFAGMKSPTAPTGNLPNTDQIIAQARKCGKQVQVD